MPTNSSKNWILKKSILEIRFTSPLKDFTFRNKIQKIITGSDVNIVPNDVVNYRDTEQRLTVVVQPMRVGITSENSKPEKNAASIITLINSLNDGLRFSQIGRVGYRQIFILECNVSSYDELVTKFKSKFLSSDSKLVASSRDVALPLTIKENYNTMNFNLGPMSSKEMLERGILDFESELPEHYILLDLDVYSSSSAQSVSHTFIKNFIAEATTDTETVTRSVAKEWS